MGARIFIGDTKSTKNFETDFELRTTMRQRNFPAITRRNFIAQAGAVAAVTAVSGGTAVAKPVPGDIKPALYSVTYLGLWYLGDALTMEQLLERAKRFGYQGIEIE